MSPASATANVLPGTSTFDVSRATGILGQLFRQQQAQDEARAAPAATAPAPPDPMAPASTNAVFQASPPGTREVGGPGIDTVIEVAEQLANGLDAVVTERGEVASVDSAGRIVFDSDPDRPGPERVAAPFADAISEARFFRLVQDRNEAVTGAIARGDLQGIVPAATATADQIPALLGGLGGFGGFGGLLSNPLVLGAIAVLAFLLLRGF